LSSLSAASLQKKESFEIKDNGQGDTELEAKLDEDVDNSHELHVQEDVNANADLDNRFDGGNDGSAEFEIDGQEGADVDDADNDNSSLEFHADGQEQIDVEGGDSRERQASEDANTDVEESEDVDGQDLDGNHDLGVQVGEDRDGGLDIDGSLNLNEDGVNSPVRLGDAGGNGRWPGADLEERQLRSTSKHFWSSVRYALVKACAIGLRGGERGSESRGSSKYNKDGFEAEHGLRC